MTNEVQSDASAELFRILLDDVTIKGIPVTLPFWAAFTVSFNKNVPGSLEVAFELSGDPGDPCRWTAVSLESGEPLAEVFSEMLQHRATKTDVVVDLRLLHNVMQFRSPEEKVRDCYTFGGDHAVSLCSMYAEWTAHVIAENCSLKATIGVDMEQRSIKALLTVTHVASKQTSIYRFKETYPEVKWREDVLCDAFSQQQVA